MREKQTKTEETSGTHPDSHHDCSCSLPPDGKRSRNLIINLDGTSNKYGHKNTNVIELYSHIEASEYQLKYYNSGIGTSAQSSYRQSLRDTIEAATASSYRKVLLGAYRWLSEQYKPGDRIFLFGFSRGAFQVRALAGMIETVGLLYEGNEEQIPFAFELYAKADDIERQKAAKQFKKTFSTKNAHVHFIGVWDTVSSIGIFRRKTLPLIDSCDHVCIFRHALALDERRVKFLPECIAQPSDKIFPKNAKEVWFAGSHSDVGGGSLPNDELNLESVSLLWMENEALMAGLHFSRTSINWKVHDLNESEPQKSLRGHWLAWDYIVPFPWKGKSDPADIHSWGWHRGLGRTIYPEQKVHASVTFKGNGYSPKANFPHEKEPVLCWKDILGTGPTGKFRNISAQLEMDLFDPDSLPSVLARLGNKDITDGDASHFLNRLHFLKILNGREKLIREENLQKALSKFLAPTDDNSLTFLTAVKLLADLRYVLPWASVAIYKKQTISAIIGMLHNHARPAALALSNLALQDSYTAQLIIEYGGVKILLDILEGPDIQPVSMALAALLPFLSGDNRNLLKSEIIKRLVQMLQGSDARDVAIILSYLERMDQLPKAILQSEDVIHALKGVLQVYLRVGGTSSAAASAVFAISVLSESDGVLKDLLKKDVPASLIVLMDSEDLAEASGRVLAKLARNSAARDRIKEAIPGLVDKLRVQGHSDEKMVTDERRRAALLALIGLAENDALRDHIIECNSVEPLVKMLSGVHAWDAVYALKCLSKNGNARKEIELKGIDAVALMLEGTGRINAAAILTGMMSEKTDRSIVATGVIPKLIAALQSDARSAIVALSWLAEREFLRNRIVDGGAVKHLVTMLDGPHAREVTEALAWLIENERAAEEILNPKIVPALVTLLENNEGGSIAALVVLREVCVKEAAARVEFMKCNAIPAVLRLLENASGEVELLLEALGKDEACCQKFIESAGNAELQKMQKHSDEDKQEWATCALELFNYPK